MPALSVRAPAIREHLVQPGAGETPAAIDRTGGDAEDFGGLIDRQPGEESQIDELCQLGLLGLQTLEGVVEIDQAVRVMVENGLLPIRYPLRGLGGARRRRSGLIIGVVFFTLALRVAASFPYSPATAFESCSLPCVVYEDSAHGTCGGGEKMLAAGELVLCTGHETQVGLVDQGGGLEGAAGSFAGDVGLRQDSQVIVDQRPEPATGVDFSAGNGAKKLGYVMR